MARPLRLEFPGALWHVMNRGVERRTLFLDDRDRRSFLTLLERTVVKSRWQLHAYVLMSNHYHLLLQTPEMTLSRGMKDLDGDYACDFNRVHSRVGHLFQGRFKAHLIDSDSYMLEVSRYIVLNPVRASMVPRAAEWPWSSYRATSGLIPAPPWLDSTPILDRFHPIDHAWAREQYRTFVDVSAGQTESPWTNLMAQAFLGGSAFLKEVEEKVRSRNCSREHPRDQRQFRAQTIDSLVAAFRRMGSADSWPPSPGGVARAAFIVLADRHTTTTHAERGRHLGITGQAAGKLLRRSQRQLVSDSSLSGLVQEIEGYLSAAEKEFRVST